MNANTFEVSFTKDEPHVCEFTVTERIDGETAFDREVRVVSFWEPISREEINSLIEREMNEIKEMHDARRFLKASEPE